MAKKNTVNEVKGALKSAANTAPVTKDNSLKGLVERMEPEILKALPSMVDPVRFGRTIQTALSSNPKLQECTQGSFLGAMMTAAQLGLEVNNALGQAYLIPYKNRGVMECQFQLGYKGLIELCYRSGRISTIQAFSVYEKDEFSYTLGLHPDIHHIPSLDDDRGKLTHVYAIYHTKDGAHGFEVMSVGEVEKHAKQHSTSYRSGYSSPWKDNFEAMAKKTVVKRVLNYAPKSIELARQISADNTIKTVPTSPSLIEDVDVLDMQNEISFEVEEGDEDVAPFLTNEDINFEQETLL